MYIHQCLRLVTAMLRQMSSRSVCHVRRSGGACICHSHPQRNNPRDSSSCVSSVGFNSTASTPGALALPHLGPISTPDSTEISMSPPQDLKTEAAPAQSRPLEACRRPSRLITDSERGRWQGSTGQAFPTYCGPHGETTQTMQDRNVGWPQTPFIVRRVPPVLSGPPKPES